MSPRAEGEWSTTLGVWPIVQEDEQTVYVTIKNYYRGTRPDFEELRNTLDVYPEEGDGIEIRLSQNDCFQLGMMFMHAYQNESWANGAEPPPLSEEPPSKLTE